MKSLLQLSCGECQTHLLAYLHHDLTPMMCRRIARHLDNCPNCYERYRNELNLMHDLADGIPRIGLGHQPNFEAIWNSIQFDIQKPKPTLPPFQLRYGLAMAVLMLSLLVPLTLSSQRLSLSSPPTQPRPVVAHLTPDSTVPKVTETTVAFLTGQFQATPEAPQHTAGPWVVDVVSTP